MHSEAVSGVLGVYGAMYSEAVSEVWGMIIDYHSFNSIFEGSLKEV